MRRRQAMLALGAAAMVALGLLTVFAFGLSNTQAKSKRDVKARVHERAVLATALIDSLFEIVDQVPQYAQRYGARSVPDRTLEANRGQSTYLALVDPSGHVLARSRGFTAQARANLEGSAALALIRAGNPYGIGNVRPYGATGVINLAVAFPTRFGVRVLLTGFAPAVLGAFINGDLHKIPGIRGAHNYIIDGSDTIIASSDPAHPAGGLTARRARLSALPRSAGDLHGTYYEAARVSHSTWRVVLAAPSGPLFAAVSGLRKWIPWLIFVAFALVAIAALALGRRALRAGEEVRGANALLGLANEALESSHAKLERRADELARSNADLEQFASIASHDLQEPLRKVRTFTQQLTVIEAERLSEKGRDYLQRANAAAERMQVLIEDLLKFSRVATHGRAFRPVELDRVCRDVLGDLEHQVQRSGAAVRIGELPSVNADAPQMRQLFQNLISNAIKFAREGVSPEVWIDATISGEVVAIVVRDNGIGFDPQYARRIFRIFERLHARTAYPGTGIGLALCRKIAERHGGTVDADGVPGVGSTFTVTLPLHQREEVIVAASPPERDGAPEPEEAYVTG